MFDGVDMSKVKTGIEIVEKVMQIAGENEDVKGAAAELGKSALTVTTAINNALLPLAAVNFAFDKARAYFSERFPQDMGAKASRIAPENVVEPKASIAGPALQGLAFAHEEPALRDLFLELLAGAMDKEREDLVHPAFVEVLKQLQSVEARLIKSVFQTSIMPIALIARVDKTDGGRVVVRRHIMNLRDSETQVPATIDRAAAMVDNWIRLGLVTVDYGQHLSLESQYSWLEDRPEMAELDPEPEDSNFRIEWIKGVLTTTEFGKQFAKSVGILE